jgi:hypothetical protein
MLIARGLARRTNCIAAMPPLDATQLQVRPVLPRILESRKTSVATDFQLEGLFHFILAAPVKRESMIHFLQVNRLFE